MVWDAKVLIWDRTEVCRYELATDCEAFESGSLFAETWKLIPESNASRPQITLVP